MGPKHNSTLWVSSTWPSWTRTVCRCSWPWFLAVEALLLSADDQCLSQSWNHSKGVWSW